MLPASINIYTDGSCHTQHLIGAWVAILFIDEEKIILSGVEKNTTHNRMELTAIINAMEYVLNQHQQQRPVNIISDSQYAIGLQAREPQFIAAHFTTKKGTAISNTSLVKTFLQLVKMLPINFTKIKAHQKITVEINYNIEADKLSRQLVRKAVILIESK